MCTVGPLRSTGITPLPRYYQPRRLPDTPAGPYVFGSAVGFHPRAGSHRFLDASVRVRSPQSPRNARRMLSVVASSPVAGFTISGRLATSDLCNEAETGSLYWGSRVRGQRLSSHRLHTGGDRPASRVQLPSPEGPPLYGERPITIADSFQSASHTRLILALQRH